MANAFRESGDAIVGYNKRIYVLQGPSISLSTKILQKAIVYWPIKLKNAEYVPDALDVLITRNWIQNS